MFSNVLDDDGQVLRAHVQQPGASSGAVAPPMQHFQDEHQFTHHHQLQHLPPTQLTAEAPTTAMNFIPHKNLMPKTTGSQAHLLSIQDGVNSKQYNSLNQTGRMMGSSLTKNGSGLMKKPKK